MPLAPVQGLHFEALGAVEEVHFFGASTNPVACFVVLGVDVPGVPGGRIRYRTTVFRNGHVVEIAQRAQRNAMLGQRLLMTGVPITGVFTGFRLTEVVHGALTLPEPARTYKSWLDFSVTGKVESFTLNGPEHAPVGATLRLTCKAPGLPGGTAYYRATFLRHAQLETLSQRSARGLLIGSTLTLRGIPMGSRVVDDNSVEVIGASIEEPEAAQAAASLATRTRA